MALVLMKPEDLKQLVEQAVSSGVAAALPDNSNEDKWMSKEDVAEFFKVSTATIDNHRLNGKLKGYNIGRYIRYKRSEILAIDNI